MEYQEFIRSKAIEDVPTGIPLDYDAQLNPALYPFQRDIVLWALRRGRACIWADCGLGKTPMQLDWASIVCNYTGGNVLILTTLAVSEQTAYLEAPKFGCSVKICEDQSEVVAGINITNYEKIDKFDFSQFSGVVLDESSILKNYCGATRNAIIEKCVTVPFRLACTATPAPNDYMELGNHAEFVGAMDYTSMLSMFFVHDGGDTAKWRLKGHAKQDFFNWIASWAVMIRKPSDLGYSDDGFILPKLNIIPVIIKTDAVGENLFPMEARSLQERLTARRDTITPRATAAAEIIAQKPDVQWCVWCNLNSEADAIAKHCGGMVNIQGSDENDKKAAAMLSFARGEIRQIVTKPKIAGLGVNWQNCHNTVFLGLSDSFEQWYQAVRRFLRFGQKCEVNAYIVIADIEGAVAENIWRKEREASEMYVEMLKYMHDVNMKNIHSEYERVEKYNADKNMELPGFFRQIGA